MASLLQHTWSPAFGAAANLRYLATRPGARKMLQTDPSQLPVPRVPLRILLVEDSEMDAELLIEALRRGGYEPVWERVDSAAGLRAALAQPWDIIICDYVLPDFGAPAALELIKARNPDLPVIVISGQVGEEIAVSSMKAGACDYINKNKLARLCPAINRELKDAEGRRARKRAETMARQLAAIVECSDDAIIGGDMGGLITSWNSGARKIYGYSAAEVIGRPLSLLAPPAEQAELGGILARIRGGEHIEHYETLHLRRDGEPVHVSLTISPITDEQDVIVGLSTISRDITEHKRAEERLQHHAARVEEANRLKDLFADIIGHDLLNPVAVINGALELLIERPHDSERDELVLLAQRNAHKLERIIRAASLYSKLEAAGALERQETDLNAVFLAAASDLRPLLTERGQRLDYRAPEPCPAVVNLIIESVFANLISNASKYSPQGGRIEVTLTDAGSHYRLSVKDWGSGIPADDRPKLFTRFQRLDKSGIKGTGLGLAIVKRIIDLHYGRVWVDDNPEGGTVFCVEIPKG